MAFYFLRHKNSDKPKNEKDFKYLVYSEKESIDDIVIDSEPKSRFALHELTALPLWNPDDEIIDVADKRGTVITSFKKIQDVRGFTVWKNTLDD